MGIDPYLKIFKNWFGEFKDHQPKSTADNFGLIDFSSEKKPFKLIIHSIEGIPASKVN